MDTTEGQNLIKVLNETGVKPKADFKEDLKAWMVDYVKQSAVEGSSASASNISIVFPQQTKMVSIFSRKEGGKGEAGFELWKYDVECLKKESSLGEAAIRRLIRTSVRGEAAYVLKRLGPKATVDDILQKFAGVYGEIDEGDDMLAEFYSACQKEGEDVSSWGCRLEDMLDRAIEAGECTIPDIDKAL